MAPRFNQGGDDARGALRKRDGGLYFDGEFRFDLTTGTLPTGATSKTLPDFTILLTLPLFVTDRDFPSTINRARVSYLSPIMAGLWRFGVATAEGRQMDGWREGSVIPGEYGPTAGFPSNGFTPVDAMQGEFEQAYRVKAGELVVARFLSRAPVYSSAMNPAGSVFIYGGHIE